MALLLKEIYESYDYVMTDLADPRSEDWFLVRSPIPIIFILAIYYTFVTNLGIKMMESRKPMKLDNVIKVYNLAQILLNGAIVVNVFESFLTLNSACSPIDYSTNYHSMIFLTYAWIYFMTKIIDLLDTIFFVLRKKRQQLTFLHIYHHMLMVAIGWIGIKYFGGGHSIYMGYINSIIHTLMYTYYFLSSFERYKKSLWFKKHMTQLQLLQFILLTFFYVRPLFDASCTYPKFPIFICLSQNALMLYLFSDFYYKTYMKKKKVSH